MTIYVVEPGDTIEGIAAEFGVDADRLVIENQIPNPDNLVVGQSIIIQVPEVVHQIQAGDTLFSIANTYGVEPVQILQNNPFLAAEEALEVGETIVISYVVDEEPLGDIIVNGYAYPFIDRIVLRQTLPFLTYLSIFTYGFTAEGQLIPAENDDELIAIAQEFNVAPLMVLAPMTADGNFNSDIAHNLFINPEAQNVLIDNILTTLEAKGYYGVDIDFEFILPQDAEAYIGFVQNMKNRLEPAGYIVTVALAPKTSADQPGLLYEAHNYERIGQIADLVLLMTYEWGYLFGPPMATGPLSSIRQVLDYGVTAIAPDRILMGIPNYAYDWPLPFIQGQTQAEALSNIEAIERAAFYNVTIEFDEQAQAPFYFYTAENGVPHVVWFDDARSMDAKFRLVNEYNLAGVGYWQIMNFFPQSWIVANTLYNIIKV
ncbi:MAG: LysM peptidoglycan-binding domain-containing protein [Clostridiales bacterium]|nr:LysM peptidoglycan-binding domain-containing protein [Clostridiales bacterium]